MNGLAGDAIQWGEHFLSMCKAVGSISSTAGKEKWFSSMWATKFYSYKCPSLYYMMF
jgi:hypothetical protein